MKNNEVNPITIIIAVVTALIVGIAIGAVAVGKYLKKELKQLVKKLQEVHKEDLKSVKTKFIKDRSKTEELLRRKDAIIEELLGLLQKKDEKGKSLTDTTLGLKAFNVITKQRKRLFN